MWFKTYLSIGGNYFHILQAIHQFINWTYAKLRTTTLQKHIRAGVEHSEEPSFLCICSTRYIFETTLSSDSVCEEDYKSPSEGWYVRNVLKKKSIEVSLQAVHKSLICNISILLFSHHHVTLCELNVQVNLLKTMVKSPFTVAWQSCCLCHWVPAFQE